MQEKRYSLTETELKELLREQRVLCDENLDYEIHGSQVEIFHDNIINCPEPVLPLPLPSEEVKPIGYYVKDNGGDFMCTLDNKAYWLRYNEYLKDSDFVPVYTTPRPVISKGEIKAKVRANLYNSVKEGVFIEREFVDGITHYLKSKLNGEEEAK